MLIAHLAPGYFAAVKSRSSWHPEWNRSPRILLYIAALGSTVLPDVDVIYNALFRGFVHHSILWTHSLIPHLTVGLFWLTLWLVKKWPFWRTLTGLVAIGGLSHLFLDVIAHGTPLLYPFSMLMVGFPPSRVVEGGFWAYLTDPIFLIEPLVLALVAWHWTLNQRFTPKVRRIILTGLVIGLISFTITFLVLVAVPGVSFPFVLSRWDPHPYCGFNRISGGWRET